MHRMRAVLILNVVLLLLASGGLVEATFGERNSDPQAQLLDRVHPPETLIGSGDLLQISVDGAPEYHHEVRVSAAGDVSLPMAGKVKLAGLSTSQAESVIVQRLQEGGFFNDPQVSVFVKEYSTEGISVLGEVQHPGIYPLLGNRTLLDAISAAGGTTPRAGKTVMITDRDRPENSKTVPLSYGDGQQMNVALHPGDTVVVSKAGMVYVIGDVKEPTGIILEGPRFTVLQAIAMAHGINRTASLKSAKVIREAHGDPQEVPIPLDMILAAKVPDQVLQADDIVFVPNSTAKTVTYRTLEAIVQMATGVVIYRSYNGH
jgi:polysaccharide export outer membrane protein